MEKGSMVGLGVCLAGVFGSAVLHGIQPMFLFMEFGSLIIVYSNAFATAKLFVPVITLSLLGVSLTGLAQLLERRLAPWKESERAE